MCIQETGTEQCRWALVLDPFGSPWIQAALVNGRWFAFGFEAAAEPNQDILPWRPDLADSAASAEPIIQQSKSSTACATGWQRSRLT
jgi:hypothetical protein